MDDGKRAGLPCPEGGQSRIRYKPEEGIISALKHGTLSIGQLGLAETLEILIGCDHTTDKGMELAIRIEKLFNDRCKEFKNNYLYGPVAGIKKAKGMIINKSTAKY